MADNDHTRQRIISSVFDKRNAGASVQESYVAHVKIWEDTGEGQGKKPRYILLSRASDSTGFVHKSKLNTNGSFSVGKTWRLAELRGIEPMFFNITLGRTYKWQTENPVDQSAFIHALIDLFRSLIGSHLHLQGVNDPAVPTLPGKCCSTTSLAYVLTALSLPASDVPTTGKQTPLPITSVTSPLSQVSHERAQTPLSQSPARSYLVNPPSRSASPADLLPGPMSHVAATQITASYRSPSPTTAQQHQQPQTALPSPLRPRVMRRPSNAVPPLSAPATGASHPSSLVPSRQPMSNPSSRHSQESVSNIRPSLDLPQGHSPLSAYPPTAALPPPRVESPALTHSVSRAEAPKTPGTPHARREHSNRVSFFDPANQAAIGRLVAGDLGEEEDTEVGQETSQATMLSVEEMLEGYDWASDDMFDRKSTRGAADLVEARLLDELTALEKANIHSFLESDDRVHLVTKYLDEALSEVDAIDSLLSSYKIHLNVREVSNSKSRDACRFARLTSLKQTVQVSDEALHTLAQESLEKPSGIQRLEEAATELYKALQASQDTEMAATMERLDEYRTYNTQFCKRLLDYLSIMVVAKAKTISEGSNGVSRENARARPTLVNHGSMETYLGRYAGLVLYLKEMDEAAYSKLCAAYFSAASDLHGKQMRTILSIYSGSIKKYSEEDSEQSFAVAGNVKAGAIRRAGTIIRSPIESQKRDRDKRRDDDYQVSEAFGYILEEIAPLINQEGYFIADFLQINDAGLTFADYTGLENYFRRQAARSAGLSQSTTKLVRGAMDLIFGFLPQEIKQWVETAIAKDTLQVVGVIVCLERFLSEAEERGNTFFLQMLDKQHLRLKGTFDRHVNQQIKMVEETKLTSKKRKGVAHFIKYFPVYVHRVEQQLVGADGLDIRTSVDLAYERIVHSMFECLKHMATLDGDGEDKGQLNYHVLLVENMHYFVAEMSQLGVNSVTGFLKQAEAMYNESLNAYVKIVLKRPFAKLIASSDFFEGVERLLKTTAPSEVQKNSSYNKSALKRVLKEFDGKDVRKHIDVLFRRVEKHFTEAEENTTREESSGITPGTVMVGVWKACEEELQRMTENFTAKLSQCYSESGLSLEYSSSDVDAAFKRHNT
ncbi:exocyst complex component Sec3-domain-containing protein [Pisolithus croceorrhizus]|nr:exocyst complex component Sec3-domain-containing protein [Pisolithus croceorrhizus]